MSNPDIAQLKMVAASLMTAFLKGDSKAVARHNDSNLTPVTSALAIVDSASYSDPDAFTNKAELWAEQFKTLFGFTEHFWHWKQGRVDTFDYELWSENADGQWVIVFYDNMLFKQKGGLGAFVLITDDQSGNMAYLADKFTHGSNYYTNIVKIPGNVKRSKDLIKMVAEVLPEWIATDLSAQHNLTYEPHVKRNGTSLTFTVGVDSSDQEQIKRNGEILVARMKALGFSGISTPEYDAAQFSLVVSGKLNHKILQNG